MTQTTFNALVNTLKELQAEEERLKSLIEVQQFEEKFGHLKDTIAIDEVWQLNAIQYLLVQKIEWRKDALKLKGVMLKYNDSDDQFCVTLSHKECFFTNDDTVPQKSDMTEDEFRLLAQIASTITPEAFDLLVSMTVKDFKLLVKIAKKRTAK